mmetsp:Transcript_36450/g.96460  ORF Transcript_36450/g.96460 Transcript_36450/m.96460 type:complete len:224 (-) Transcript_36450:175-846(-)
MTSRTSYLWSSTRVRSSTSAAVAFSRIPGFSYELRTYPSWRTPRMPPPRSICMSYRMIPMRRRTHTSGTSQTTQSLTNSRCTSGWYSTMSGPTTSPGTAVIIVDTNLDSSRHSTCSLMSRQASLDSFSRKSIPSAIVVTYFEITLYSSIFTWAPPLSPLVSSTSDIRRRNLAATLQDRQAGLSLGCTSASRAPMTCGLRMSRIASCRQDSLGGTTMSACTMRR